MHLTQMRNKGSEPNPFEGQKNNSKMEVINKLAKLYTKCSEDNLSMEDTGQTLSQFLSMKGIEPNDQGSGRYSFRDIHKIECLYFHNPGMKQKKIPKRECNKISQLITLYTGIPVSQSDSILEVRNSSIVDASRNLEYTLKMNKSRFNALQLLDLLVEYKTESNLLIGFIEHGLHQNKEDVYGRACGNGVAIIDLQLLRETQKSKFYQTTIHETLHTLGFDHCLAYNCLMNPCLANNMWLCPCCLNKLHSEIDVDFTKWVLNLSTFYKNQLKENRLLHQKSEKILKTITALEGKQQEVALVQQIK